MSGGKLGVIAGGGGCSLLYGIDAPWPQTMSEEVPVAPAPHTGDNQKHPEKSPMKI